MVSLKHLCDCCGNEITKGDYMVLNLLPFKTTRRLTFDKSPVFSTSNQELCNSCAGELYEHYRLMKASKQGKPLKRICLSCGYEDDNNVICPVCKSQNWSIEEE